MLDRIFPGAFDNRYRGNRFGLWLFYPLVLFNLMIDLATIFRPDSAAQSADGIPLDRFGHDAAGAVIGVAALLGLAGLLLGALFLLAALRYRAMIPLMYLLMVADNVGHKAILLMKPIVRVAGTSSGTIVTWSLFAASVLGFVLSLQGAGYRKVREIATV